MFLRTVNAAVDLIGERLVEKNSSDETSPQDTTQLTNKAQFTVSHHGDEFRCEECGHRKFVKLNDIKMRCARDWCKVVYNVEYSVLDLEIVFYEG